MIVIARFSQALLAVSDLLAWSSAAAGRRPWLAPTFPKPQDSKAQSLRQYRGQMTLVANTASFCGFAGLHGRLDFVHNKYTIHRDGARVEGYRSLIAPDSRTFDARIGR